MTTIAYPKRERFFALKFCRTMTKVCLANSLGPEAFTLLSVIVCQEDASGYRRPVTFWNGQLFPLVGLGSESALRRLRIKVIEAGWLQCIPGVKGRPPAYFVTIPDVAAGLDD
ncbi:MAG TPA: phage replication protein, partial [Verrucomicrobiales bacterium]|nr:phage replication protein [Verrucomicrobiales bacterium]